MCFSLAIRIACEWCLADSLSIVFADGINLFDKHLKTEAHTFITNVCVFVFAGATLSADFNYSRIIVVNLYHPDF